jgi:predicted flap endonuclease-1-like 5' DNA nuclease
MEATNAMTMLQLPETPADAGKALSLPLGMASPLWFAYAGAAAAGAAFWWMSRWTRATNLEALVALPDETAAAAVDIVETTAETLTKTVVESALESVAEAVPALEPVVEAIAPEPVAEASAEIVPEIAAEAAPEILPEAVAEPVAAASDDLTRIVGIGPKLASALTARGLTSFGQLAALQAADLEALDKAMDLKGRAVRDAWVAQAARFAQLH